ncbi:MAG: prepilin-type N-terminal cleavage/methylation domain-containing protein [Bryobacterales bacterium]|nr:prepilin-type N-terminal cleavage/methylation domain-containing protein [Bryobacterales bacterium]
MSRLHRQPGRRGVTLVEMMVVVGIVSLLAGISFPAISSGIDTLRLSSACDAVATFLNGALNRAERRQQAVEISVLPSENRMWIESTEPGFRRQLELPEGVRIAAVLPALPVEIQGPRRFIVLPGGVAPRLGVELRNRRGVRRTVQVDPITGVPEIRSPETE